MVRDGPLLVGGAVLAVSSIFPRKLCNVIWPLDSRCLPEHVLPSGFDCKDNDGWDVLLQLPL